MDAPQIGDAFGLTLLDHLENGADARPHVIERDDGLIEVLDAAIFFDAESPWTGAEAQVPERAGQRVLDVGAGAGRHSLPLQESGRTVVALDTSPGAVEVCSRRGIAETFEGTVFDLAGSGPEPFDTFLLCGNNFGLLEGRTHGPEFLRALAGMAAPGAEVIGTSRDPFDTAAPRHLAYHQWNRDRGRLPGQIGLRSRWANVATPWHDYLLLEPGLLAEIASEAGWSLVHHDEGPGPYLAVLRLSGA